MLAQVERADKVTFIEKCIVHGVPLERRQQATQEPCIFILISTHQFILLLSVHFL